MERQAPRVLVVDDEISIRALCRANLEIGGYEVIEAADGNEAVAAIERHLPDLVLLDVMMPGLDGWEVAAHVAASLPSIPVVFISARAAYEDRVRAHETGAVGYVVKPFDPTKLSTMLDQMLERLERGERDALRRELLEDER